MWIGKSVLESETIGQLLKGKKGVRRYRQRPRRGKEGKSEDTNNPNQKRSKNGTTDPNVRAIRRTIIKYYKYLSNLIIYMKRTTSFQDTKYQSSLKNN
jgi:hypothetical protein